MRTIISCSVFGDRTRILRIVTRAQIKEIARRVKDRFSNDTRDLFFFFHPAKHRTPDEIEKNERKKKAYKLCFMTTTVIICQLILFRWLRRGSRLFCCYYLLYVSCSVQYGREKATGAVLRRIVNETTQ